VNWWPWRRAGVQIIPSERSEITFGHLPFAIRVGPCTACDVDASESVRFVAEWRSFPRSTDYSLSHTITEAAHLDWTCSNCGFVRKTAPKHGGLPPDPK
jgi:hypothetical protein